MSESHKCTVLWDYINTDGEMQIIYYAVLYYSNEEQECETDRIV